MKFTLPIFFLLGKVKGQEANRRFYPCGPFNFSAKKYKYFILRK